MKTATIVFSVAMACGIVLAGPSCPSETAGAVLDYVWPHFHGNVQDLNEMSGSDITSESVKREQEEIDCLRKWADKNTKECVHSAYISWLDYYQSQLNDAKKELATKKEESGQTKYERELNAERARIDRYKKLHPMPVPPAICTDYKK